MNKRILIPKRCKVGFHYREETYSKKLAFVIYFDDKGILRQEDAWKGWLRRDPKAQVDFPPFEFDNKPTEGFVLNKNIGRRYSSYGWNARVEKVRTFDPRGFEFEMSVPNLLFILQECTSSKGKGLEGEFVYGWVGGKIQLIPVCSQEYKDSLKYTEGLKGKVPKKDLVPGCTYLSKQQVSLVYLGQFNYSEDRSERDYVKSFSVSNGHVFLNPLGVEKEWRTSQDEDRWLFIKPVSLSARLSESPVENYAELMDDFNQSRHSVLVKNYTLLPFDLRENEFASRNSWGSSEEHIGTPFAMVETDTFRSVRVLRISSYSNGWFRLLGYKIDLGKIVTLSNGELKITDGPEAKKDDKVYTTEEINSMNLKTIVVDFNKGKSLELKV